MLFLVSFGPDLQKNRTKEEELRAAARNRLRHRGGQKGSSLKEQPIKELNQAQEKKKKAFKFHTERDV